MAGPLIVGEHAGELFRHAGRLAVFALVLQRPGQSVLVVEHEAADRCERGPAPPDNYDTARANLQTPPRPRRAPEAGVAGGRCSVGGPSAQALKVKLRKVSSSRRAKWQKTEEKSNRRGGGGSGIEGRGAERGREGERERGREGERERGWLAGVLVGFQLLKPQASRLKPHASRGAATKGGARRLRWAEAAGAYV